MISKIKIFCYIFGSIEAIIGWLIYQYWQKKFPVDNPGFKRLRQSLISVIFLVIFLLYMFFLPSPISYLIDDDLLAGPIVGIVIVLILYGVIYTYEVKRIREGKEENEALEKHIPYSTFFFWVFIAASLVIGLFFYLNYIGTGRIFG